MKRVLIFLVKRPKTDFDEEEVVSFLRHHITQSRALGRVVNVFLCIFIYFMTIALLVQVGDILRILDIFVQLSSSSNRFGRIRERKNKRSNSKDSRFRVSISERPSDLLGQLPYTQTHP